MKNFDPERPLWLYQLWEYLLLYDGKSEEERLLAYRYGWLIYSKNKLHFEDYTNLLLRRKWFIYLSLVYPIILTAASLLLALSIWTVEVWMKVPIAVIFSILTAAIIYALIGNTLKNIRETKIFLAFLNPSVKIINFREFENMDCHDLESAELFYENMRAKRDYLSINVLEKGLDKTEKLLAIDFLLGEPGSLNDLINKMSLNPNSCLTKEGIYKVIGEVLSASPDNIKKEITKGIKEIRIGEKLSTKRMDQLRTVKSIFCKAKLVLKANEVDNLLV